MSSMPLALPASPEPTGGTGSTLGVTALARHAAIVGRGYHVEATSQRALVEGRFCVDGIEAGMTLRQAAIRNRIGMRNRAEVAPGLKLIVFMAGTTEVRFDGQPLPLCPGGSTALLVNLRHPVAFERRAEAGTRESSLTLTLSSAWLDQSAETAPLQEALPHLMIRRWQPDTALDGAARALLASPMRDGETSRLANLQRDAVALSMANQGLATLFDTYGETGPGMSRQQQRLQTFIDSGEADSASLGAIAAHLGMSTSTLQRLSQHCYGMSLQRHLRRRRLEAARQALHERGVSVDTAAELAGYADATNFATAFRRAFGLTPREARRGAR
ncbi:helix-turn-helix domain-containing protein [Salinicola aestuarinus]|uniref:helix-turn-helix domain-containing protein n=1 Tax=Salinicola aestuarinus TaxID=1949082 RepID=UPI000DA23B2D|nr:AraC family transcriptional regulator [Salinicola aestuarinus]